MAEMEIKKESFPLMPVKQWWALRKKFKQSIPGVVTVNYLSTVLDMKPISARNNVLPYLKMVGIIDLDGKPLELAKRWRDDAEYSSVCDEIKIEVYPPELLDAIPNVSTERPVVERWFANHTGAGEVGVRKMASFYLLLLEADPTKVPETSPTTTKPIKSNIQLKKPAKLNPVKEAQVESESETIVNVSKPNLNVPSINLNLQIHISADASPEQIEQIFASMAKHVYQRNS